MTDLPSKEWQMRKAVERRLNKAAETRATIRGYRDLTSRGLAQRPAAGDAESSSYLPVFDLLDEELDIIEHDLVGAEHAYALRMMKLPQLRRKRRELTEHVDREQKAADRFDVALRRLNPCAGVKIDPVAMAEALETRRREVEELEVLDVEVAGAEALAERDRHLTEIAATQFDEVLPWVKRILSGLVGLGGAVEVSKRAASGSASPSRA